MANPRAPLDIVQVGHPVLRQQARPLELDELASPRIQKLIADMQETMRAAPGVGLAAPQIGEPLQLAVIEDEQGGVPFHVVVNPIVTVRTEDLVRAFEGCLSFAGFRMIVPRARKVRLEAFDEHGQRYTKVATDWYARIVQHECDHLAGTVCIDRAETRTLCNNDNYTQYWQGKPVEDARDI
jgi:peptide deformylase|nr:peptide deformylase [Kofleriaceae bacterium]